MCHFSSVHPEVSLQVCHQREAHPTVRARESLLSGGVCALMPDEVGPATEALSASGALVGPWSFGVTGPALTRTMILVGLLLAQQTVVRLIPRMGVVGHGRRHVGAKPHVERTVLGLVLLVHPLMSFAAGRGVEGLAAL